MSTNSGVAQIFYAIADLLDLQSERFKPDAYRRAARSIESLGEDLRNVAQRGALDEIPGVGEALHEKIGEYLRDGRISYYDKLQATFPPGVLELMRIPGIGPKTTGRFYLQLQIDSPTALAHAIDQGRLVGLSGFGPRKIEKLREALRTAAAAPPAARTPLLTAWRLARSVISELSSRTPVQDITAAGSLRRCRESVGDLDILATSARPPETIAVFTGLAGVRSILLQGDTKATVIHEPGIQIDLRVVEPASFGAALQYFTGSKDHNIHLRSLARDLGLKINEYGVLRGEERVAGVTEAEVYESLGLAWIPPEIRENQGEIEAAQTGHLPTLVSVDQLRGELHRHLPDAPTAEWMAALVTDARRRGFQYLGLVVPAARNGDSLGRLVPEVRRFWSDAAPGALRLRLGLEVVLGGPTDRYDPESLFDYLIGVPAPGPAAQPPTPPATRPPRRPAFVGHLRLGPAGGDAPRESTGPWIEWCATHGVALELTPLGIEDGLDAAGARRAREAGVGLVLSGGLGDLSELELSVGRARRAWVSAEGVLNSRADGVGAAAPKGPKRKRPAPGAGN
ncbi:MAG: helix-hairpin-helix domain-containing protein [Thermoplasmata archaeon]|nr:helix-hairpin-helix domain-containing protein [Thermoplasmata archaeon]